MPPFRPTAAVRFAWLVAALGLGLWLASPAGLRDTLRERTTDLLHGTPAEAGAAEVVVVDIDRAALERIGAWPWSRATLAALLRAVAAAEPAAVALDMLIAEPDRLSPAALARRLAAVTGREELAGLAATLEDGDAMLAEAIAAAPTALGLLPEQHATEASLPAVPILLRDAVQLPGIGTAPGLQGPTQELAAAAEGFGLLTLDADVDGRVRRVPLLALVGGVARPGLAVEAVRLQEGAGALQLEADPLCLVIGSHRLMLDASATLRLLPAHPAGWPARSLSAAALLAEPERFAARLADRIVLVGGSAPELGGLRPAARGMAVPSVQLQADAVLAVLRGVAPRRPQALVMAETLGTVALVLGVGLAGMMLRPRHAALVAAAMIAAWVAAAWLLTRAGLQLDGGGPPLLAAIGYVAAAIATYFTTERRARALEARFEQRLAPAVVRRILAAPEAIRLDGELREVTALFTDIEGFTAMTERAAPAELVALLDSYLDAMTATVVAHDGMVEKIVGDAVHAVFNAPLDVPEHPRRALDCALALLAVAEAQRATPLGRRLGLGRTRIGLETGPAVVGDVGGSGKLDYTAHGNVMNTAARLEAANKQLGTSICIGPVAAARIGHERLVPLGPLAVRGRAAVLEVFTVPPLK